LSFKGIFISKTREQCSKCEGYRHYDYQCPSKSRHVNIVSSDDVDDSRVVEDIYVLSEINSVIEHTLVDFSSLILDEVHVSSDVDALVESSSLSPDNIYVHKDDTSHSEHVLIESSMYD